MLFYDLFDRVIKEAYNVSTNTGSIKDGSPATMTINPLGKTLSFTYDSLKHLSKVTVPDIYTRNYTYRGLTSTRSTNQIERVSYTLGSSTTAGLYYDYTYDDAGNITTVKQNGSQIAKYEYDEQGQLLKETRGGTTYWYIYDTAGNILEVSPVGLPASEAYTYSTGAWKDLLTSIKINGTTKSISYDASGNPENWYNGNTLTNLEWSKGRQLTKLNKDSTVIEYAYDMSGIRSSKKVGSDTYYYITQNGQVVRQTWGSKILDIVYDNNGQPFAMCYSTDNGSTFTDYYYITNVQGDVVRLVNSAGTTVANYTYDAWGKVLNVTSASGATITDTNNIANINPIRYRGYYYDTETGWYYLQSRYYDPEIGRFINADIYLSTAQGLIGYNMFAYVLNNPIRFVDPSGEIITAAAAATVKEIATIAAILALVYLVFTPSGREILNEFATAINDAFNEMGEILVTIAITLPTILESSRSRKRDKPTNPTHFTMEQSRAQIQAKIGTREDSKQRYDYWIAFRIGVKVVVSTPLYFSEACLWVAMGGSVMCRTGSAARAIVFVNGYANAVGPEIHGGEGYYWHYHPTRNHTGYDSIHIWYYS